MVVFTGFHYCKPYHLLIIPILSTFSDNDAPATTLISQPEFTESNVYQYPEMIPIDVSGRDLNEETLLMTKKNNNNNNNDSEDL